MTDSDFEIGGLRLPASLISALEEGRWRVPQNMSILAEVFREEPDGPQFYDLASMARQNQLFQQMSATDLYGPADRETIDTDHTCVVLIGDLGADMPIALDYRHDRLSPRVIYLSTGGWIEVARDFAELCRLLEL